VYDVGAIGERFDVVFFMGVLYHLRHPLLALDLIWEDASRDLLVFQSLQRGDVTVTPVAEDCPFWDDDHFLDPGYSKLSFIERSYAQDYTNWWAPNRACAAAMLRSAGFAIVAEPEEEIFICRRGERPAYSPGATYPSIRPSLGDPA
jgi:tRNA (mo5U34)-methyltransferase